MPLLEPLKPYSQSISYFESALTCDGHETWYDSSDEAWYVQFVFVDNVTTEYEKKGLAFH